MSNSKYIPDTTKSGKLPEKSNFAQTCNLLSQYMKKDKVNLINLSFGINPKPPGKPEFSTPTVNLLDTMDKTADVFPHLAGEDTTNKPSYSKPATMEAKAGQMTIFYGGQVLVFDNFPAEKVSDIILSANKGNSQNTSGFTGLYSVADGTMDEHGCSTSSSNPALDWRQSQAMGSDMPIARRASLNRFLEKRKDRATVRAPYQLQNPYVPSPKRDQEEQFDLNL